MLDYAYKNVRRSSKISATLTHLYNKENLRKGKVARKDAFTRGDWLRQSIAATVLVFAVRTFARGNCSRPCTIGWYNPEYSKVKFGNCNYKKPIRFWCIASYVSFHTVPWVAAIFYPCSPLLPEERPMRNSIANMNSNHILKLVNEKVNTEDLIYEVERHPEIWNSALEEYGSKVKRKGAWHDIVVNFMPDFHDKPLHERKEICEYDTHPMMMVIVMILITEI